RDLFVSDRCAGKLQKSARADSLAALASGRPELLIRRSDHMSNQSRREFIKTGAGAAGAGLMLPVLNRTAAGTTIVKQLADDAVGNGNVLVIVELAGGNDGLNTIIPLRQY